jgi:hypothetical protein
VRGSYHDVPAPSAKGTAVQGGKPMSFIFTVETAGFLSSCWDAEGGGSQ